MLNFEINIEIYKFGHRRTNDFNIQKSIFAILRTTHNSYFTNHREESLHFVNDLKKSGLLVIGHVNICTMDEADHQSQRRKLDFWVDFVKENRIKAFVEHTNAVNNRQGSEQLLR